MVTVSEFLRRQLLEGIPTPSTPPDVLPNCIDLAALPPPARREKTILFVGRVVPEKAPDAFVAACAAALPRLPGWRAEIIGADRFRADSPDTDFVRGVRTAAQAAGVALLGYRDHPDVLAAMARAAIVVMPSRWQEPFGLTALEAMASGAALLCSARGGLPEVGGEAAVYVDPDDPAGMAQAIVSLASDPARLAALSLAGRDRARRFDLAPTRRRLDAIRASILAAPNSRQWPRWLIPPGRPIYVPNRHPAGANTMSATTTPKDADLIPVTVLTGYLGAGKTTLLNRILTENHGRKYAVVINEFGELGVDNDLVVDTDEEVFEMNNGCICCTVRGDLIRIVGGLMKRRDKFDGIIIETTGLANPAPVAQTFFVDDGVRARTRLDAIVTVVDAKNLPARLLDSSEAADQIAFADVIVLNKTDLVTPEELRSRGSADPCHQPLRRHPPHPALAPSRSPTCWTRAPSTSTACWRTPPAS